MELGGGARSLELGGGRLGCGGSASMNGVSAFKRETPRTLSPLLPSEDMVRKWLCGNQ